MAERITDFTEARRVGGPRKYPWQKWTDGAKWRIKQGKDFHGSPRAMASLIRKHAHREGLAVTAHVYEDRVEFQFFASEREKENAARRARTRESGDSLKAAA